MANPERLSRRKSVLIQAVELEEASKGINQI